MVNAPTYYTSTPFNPFNNAFLKGDAVQVTFFVKNGVLVMAEESYFFLMASMRKMKLPIPLSYTLEFFIELFNEPISNLENGNARINFIAFNNQTDTQSVEIAYAFSISEDDLLFQLKNEIEIDLIKEINVNTNLLSSIKVHCPENIYALKYAKENDLDDVILLNPNKRIARAIQGNLLFLKESVVSVPKQSEGAYISPLMENFITYLHNNNLVEINPTELIAFESQKAEEIVLISDEKGLFSVKKIRNKNFGNQNFAQWISAWEKSIGL